LANLVWTIRVVGEKLALIEQARVARDHNRPISLLRRL
jgi:hypothetical protein